MSLLKEILQRQRSWLMPSLLVGGCVLLCFLGAWAGYACSMHQMRRVLVASRIEELRSSADHVVRLIEDDLAGASAAIDAESARDDRLQSAIEHVDTARIDDSTATFWALVGDNARVIGHSQQAEPESNLESSWYDARLPEFDGDVGDVYATTAAALTGGRKAIVIRFPLVARNATVAELYHGFFERALDRRLEEERLAVAGRWALGALVSLALITAGVAISLQSARRRTARLTALAAGTSNRPIAPLVAGLAHEFRNPLHAIRLNLHAVAQTYQSERRDRISEADVIEIVAEASREIDRLEALMRQVLGYASPAPAVEGAVDANSEVDAALGFVHRVADEKHIRVTRRISTRPALVGIHRDRFRQTVLNLLENACDAAGEGGRIAVAVEERRKTVDIIIADDGPGVAIHLRQKIFDPFFSTKSHGTGLGLALARHYVEQVGGQIHCEPEQPSGTRFRIELPRVANGAAGQS